MEAAAFVAIFVALIIAFALLGTDRRVADEKARQRRMAEHRMNARLLRFNI